MRQTELENSNNTEAAELFYLNCTINITPGFFIVPEVGMITLSEDATSTEPATFYWGAKWHINF